MANSAARRTQAACAVILAVVTQLVAGAQAPTRRATTTTALTAFPAFFGGQQVVVRTEIVTGPNGVRLAGEGPPIYVVQREPLPQGLLEIRGEFWDLSRLPADDPRIASQNLDAALGRPEDRRLKPGEAFCLIVRSANEASPPPAPTVRSIVLDPHRYLEQRVTLTGQFRGRNLYGDLPQAPGGSSRSDFVLRVADAAIWVTGVRPRGKGFDLDPGARVDTGRWLEVSGVVRFDKGITWIEANQVLAAKPMSSDNEEESPAPPVVGPAPEVVFSAPTADETDVALDTAVRIQFSRDLDASTIPGQVRVGYLPSDPPALAGALPDPPDVTPQYDAGGRILVLRFSRGLDAMRTLRVELLDGIRATDGAALKPWTLTFRVGG